MSKNKKKHGQPKMNVTTEMPEKESNIICSKCFSKIGKGYAHDCSRRGKVSNVQNLLCDTPTTAQRYASRVISQCATQVLATLGPTPKSVSSGPTKKKKLFTVEDMAVIQQDLSLSNRKMKILAEDMRSASGSRNIIEKSMSEKTIKKNCQLEDMFETKLCNFVTISETNNTRENFQQHIAICSDLNGLVEKMIVERGVDEDHMLIELVLTEVVDL